MSVCPCKKENRDQLKIKPAVIVLISLARFLFWISKFWLGQMVEEGPGR